MSTHTGADVRTLGEDREITGGRLWASRVVAALLLLVRLPSLATATSTGEGAGMLLGIAAVAWAIYWVLLRVLSSAGDGGGKGDGEGAFEAAG
jgi:hypothetical protein